MEILDPEMNLDSEAGDEEEFEEGFTNSYGQTESSEEKNRPASGLSDR